MPLRTESYVQVTSLASGSSGNSMLIQSQSTNLLIDAGVGQRRIGSHLLKRGILPGMLHGILLTHEHHDHAQGAVGLSTRYSAPLVANRPTFQALSEHEVLPAKIVEMETGTSNCIGDVEFRSFPVSHDAAEPVGYVIDIGSIRIAYFTDSGCVTPYLQDALCGADLAIVEANYDEQWLLRGPYTREMKARVASAKGHLSNADCGDLLAERVDSEGPLTIWLAHLSRVNNSPALARRTVQDKISNLTRTSFVLEVALRDQPSVVWKSGSKAVQMSLF